MAKKKDYQAKSEEALIEEVMSALIYSSRISISLGLHNLSVKIYQAEYELEKIIAHKNSARPSQIAELNGH